MTLILTRLFTCQVSFAFDGVCIYIRSSVPCSRIHDFETPEIESLWIKLRPQRLPRHVSLILVAVVYHSTSCGADDNLALLQHLQVNTGSFLQQHPEGLILITETTCITNLSQIIKVLTRDSGIFLSHLYTPGS